MSRSLAVCMLQITFFGSVATAQITLARHEQTANGIQFSLPDGLQVESVATAPLVQWPIVADWDDQRRLVIAESAGVREKVQEQLVTRPHRLVRLIDCDGDGVFDERLVAATDLSFPEGVLCLGNRILVAAPPQIWELIDEDGDGVCESRQVWFDGQTLTGCANDLHGPYRGRDGWIYWCKGAFAEQHYSADPGHETDPPLRHLHAHAPHSLTTKASHIFRRRPEGGPIEAVMTGGMDNPVELAFNRQGERFFTSTFLQHPADGRRDGLAHAIYGALYGKDHHVLNGHRTTVGLMPIMTHLGAAAPSGLACLDQPTLLSDLSIAAEPGQTLAATLFNLQRVTLHRLIPTGATYRTEDHDLLVADRIDFHPTDVLEDADGSLIVLDTGGWYNLCCPSSKIDQAAALGGIYRITSPSTRNARAQRLQSPPSAHQPLDSATSDDLLATQLQSPHPENRHLAANSLSLLADPRHAPLLRKALSTEQDPLVKRVLCESLGRIGDATAVELLLQTGHETDDLALRHAAWYALLEIGPQPELLDALTKALDDQQVARRAAAITVLDQLHSPNLTSQHLADALRSDNELLQRVAQQALARRPDWQSELLQRFDVQPSAKIDDVMLAALRVTLTTHADHPASRAWLSRQLFQDTRPAWLLDLLTSAAPKNLPEGWGEPLSQWLRQSSAETRESLAQWLGTVAASGADANHLASTLVALADEEVQPRRKLILSSVLPANTTASDDLSKFLVDQLLAPSEETWPAAMASQALLRVRLNQSDAVRLKDQLQQVPPLQLISAITAISRIDDPDLQASLLQRLAELPTARTLAPEAVTNLYRQHSASLRDLARLTMERLATRDADATIRLEQMLETLPAGDAVRGYQVFRSAKAACSACHRVGYVGGQVGPELSRIGGRRTRADLLEAIMLPSARQEQSYQATQVLTASGQVFNGLVVQETASELVLRVTAEQTVRIALDEIETRRPSPVSLMPGGLDELLTRQQLADLLVFLENAK